MAAKKSTATDERIDPTGKRIDLARTAAGQIEKISLSFMAQSEPDPELGSDPRPIPAVVVYEMAARVRDLASAVMSALGDDVVPTDELQKVVSLKTGAFAARMADARKRRRK